MIHSVDSRSASPSPSSQQSRSWAVAHTLPPRTAIRQRRPTKCVAMAQRPLKLVMRFLLEYPREPHPSPQVLALELSRATQVGTHREHSTLMQTSTPTLVEVTNPSQM